MGTKPRCEPRPTGGLSWYDDEEALDVLVDGLGDQYGSVTDAARDSLAFRGSEAVREFLRAKLDSMQPVRKVYAARVLQLMDPGTYPEVFSNFLKTKADELKDYAATVEAIEGLRDAYLREPVIAAVEALHDERREIRLAATLALAGRGDSEDTKNLLVKASTDKDPHFRMAVAKALWALAVVRKADADRARAGLLFSKKNFRGAEQTLDRVNPEYFGTFEFIRHPPDYTSMLEAGLSVAKSSKLPSGVTFSSSTSYIFFDDAFRPKGNQFDKLACDINAATGEISAALDTLQSVVAYRPSLRKSLADDPHLASLHSIYEFQVLTGMREPITVENIKLPQPNRPSPKASAENSK